MRELKAELTFTKHCLGNVRRNTYVEGKKHTYFALQRSPDGRVMFLPRWWRSNMVFAAELLCRHQSEVDRILFDPTVDGKPAPIPESLYRRYYEPERFSKHEAFFPGDKIHVRAAVPDVITEVDFHKLLDYAGRYKGISPAFPTEYGFFTVEVVLAQKQ